MELSPASGLLRDINGTPRGRTIFDIRFEHAMKIRAKNNTIVSHPLGYKMYIFALL